MVTTWAGRSPADAPAAFRRALFDADSPGETTYFIVIDPTGRVQRVIPGGTMRGGRPGTAVSFVRAQLTEAVSALRLATRGGTVRDVRLPDVDGAKSPGPAGVRLFVRLPDHEQLAYRVPVVKAVPMSSNDWNVLAYPTVPRNVAASELRAWLADLFPPAMKEMVGPGIRNDEFRGTLRLTEAGADGSSRYAVLQGDLQLVLAGRTDVTHSGTLQAVLTYPLDRDSVATMRAVFDGIYPESDPRQNRTTRRRYVAAIESRPK